MSTMVYKGYVARIEFSAEERLFVGRLVGIRDAVGFQGASVDELETAFHDAVDQYLACCADLKRAPDRSTLGRATLHIDPDLHARADVAARRAGKSLNRWIVDLFAKETERSWISRRQ